MNFYKILLLIIFLILNAILLFALDNSNDDLSDDYNYLMQGETLDIFSTQEISQNIKTINKEDIKKYNSKDLADLLKNALNLPVRQNGGNGTQSSFSIRGNTSSEVLVLINGIPVNSAQYGSTDLSNIPLNSIKKIEVIYGGSDTKFNYSGAMGGIINIITEERRNSNLYVNLDVSNLFYYPDYYYIGAGTNNKYFPEVRDFFDTQKILTNFGIGKDIFYWDFSAGANIANNHFLYKDTYDVIRQMDHSFIWDINCKNSFTFNLPNYMQLVISNTYYHGDKNIHGPMYYTNYEKQVDNQSFSYISFNANKVGTDKIDTQAYLSHTYSNLKWNDQISDDTHNVHTVMASDKWDFLPFDWLYIQTGGDFTYNYMDSTAIGEKYLFNGGGYFTTEFTILKVAKIIGSVKINYDRDFINVIPIIPKLGVVFFLGNYCTLKSNFYRTYRNPTFNDLYWPKDSFAEGNPNLKPENGLGGDIIFSFSKKGILSFETSAYVNYIKDAILWDPGTDNIYRPSNVGKAFYFGSENNIKSDFSKYVDLNVSYNFLLTYVLTNDLTFESDKRMPYQPMHSFGFGITAKWNPDKEFYGNVNITGHYESERYTNTLNAGYLQPFFTLDISFNQNFCKVFTFYAVIKNAFNTHYFLIDTYPMPAGSVTLGIKINYETKFKEKGDKKYENKFSKKL